MPGPAPVRLDSNLWRAHADTLRAGPAADPAAYRHSEASLTLGMTDAAGCLHSFVRSLGQAAFDDAVADAIHGTETRKGLLEEPRTSAESIEFPKAWFLKCLNQRLIDVVRRLGRERAFVAAERGAWAPSPRPAGRGEDTGEELGDTEGAADALDFDRGTLRAQACRHSQLAP